MPRSNYWSAAAKTIFKSSGIFTEKCLYSLSLSQRWKMTFPNDFLDLLRDETKALLYLATTMPDGSPQVSPVWFSTDGEHVLINTNEGRTKDRNMKARPQVAMVIQDPTNQDRYLGIRGEVVGFTREGANE